jgi:hypothetical protein
LAQDIQDERGPLYGLDEIVRFGSNRKCRCHYFALRNDVSALFYSLQGFCQLFFVV